jgi:phytoene synthase
MPEATPTCDAQHASDLIHCRERIRVGSHSFYAASRLLPRRVRQAAYPLYAFCRLADDRIDEEGGRIDAVAELRQRVALMEVGQPLAHPVDRALSRVMATHTLPGALLLALIEGLEWDAQGRRYARFEELLDYGARVASAVGAMMAVLMGVRGAAALARACDLGMAMQLTNIARDVGEDARNGRLYLPLDWLHEAGIDPEAFLTHPTPTAPLRTVTMRLLSEAERLYASGLSGLRYLPADCRPAILAAGRIYREIGTEIARASHDSVTRRAVVSRPRKLSMLARAWAWPHADATARLRPPLPAVRALVQAVARTDTPGEHPEDGASLYTAFSRLGHREKGRTSASATATASG